jgi:ABC-type transport system involved in cytochrome c biogenesis permease subunit
MVGEYLLTASVVLVVISLGMYLVVISAARRVSTIQAKVPVLVGAEPTTEELLEASVSDDGDPKADPGVSYSSADIVDEVPEKKKPAPKVAPAAKKSTMDAAVFAHGFAAIAFILVSAYIVIRWILAGHGPFSNMHEFAISFVWGILLTFLVVMWRFKTRILAVLVLPVVAALLIFAIQVGTEITPLVPALQNSLMLTLHVGFAAISYGAACVSFGAAIVYLLYPRLRLKVPRDRFDEIGYKGAVVAFPLMTVMIILGAIWAKTAWGRYWGWDPKETAALVTWLVYAGFLHARIVAGWRGTRAAVMLILGFAAVMFAYFGNYFLGGLHAYTT